MGIRSLMFIQLNINGRHSGNECAQFLRKNIVTEIRNQFNSEEGKLLDIKSNPMLTISKIMKNVREIHIHILIQTGFSCIRSKIFYQFSLISIIFWRITLLNNNFGYYYRKN